MRKRQNEYRDVKLERRDQICSAGDFVKPEFLQLKKSKNTTNFKQQTFDTCKIKIKIFISVMSEREVQIYNC